LTTTTTTTRVDEKMSENTTRMRKRGKMKGGGGGWPDWAMMAMVLAFSMVSADDECINPGTTWQNGLGGENQSFGALKELVRNLRNSNDSPRFVVVVSQLVGPVHGVPRAPASRREVPLAAPAASGHPSSGGLHERLEVWCAKL
jgi:hypothetical protein